ncbi:universal stress protein [Massilia sp. MS-15]|uniref:universal stress protein n=1 Tax=Massilia sp. MS-15 TaxID=2878200 RepID=UPI001CD415F8|nr:universal stress protein [Massilia sp. MS-15]MCA1247952.1 universal stress protein [Massilia sp. MS-15]
MFLERICIATDGSDLAIRAAELGVLLASSGAGRVVVVSVAQPQFRTPDSDGAAPDAQAAQEEFERARHAARAHADTVGRIARGSGVSCDYATPLASKPGPEIIRVAEQHGCDLIVMGTHGPNDANRMFTGDVAGYVLANSPIRVLLLRDPHEAAQPDFTEGTLA